MASRVGASFDADLLCREVTRRLAAGDRLGAERVADEAVAHWPQDPRVLSVAGACAMLRGQFSVAIDRLERSLVFAPDDVESVLNLGFAYRLVHRLEEAKRLFRALVTADPNNVDAWVNLSAAFVNEGTPVEGEAVVREAIRYCPESYALRWNHALVLLEQGRWREGWKEYRCRFEVPALRGAVGRLCEGIPRLPSPESIRGGQRLICRGEQGLGDEILFAGLLRDFIDDAIARGGEVFIAGNRRLERVYRCNFGDGLWAGRGDGISADWVVPLGDLPGYYRNSDSSFPMHSGYLIADPKASQSLRRQLRCLAQGRPIVGLAPSGGSRWTHGAHRTVPAVDWMRVLSVPALFVGLDYHERDELAEVAATSGAEYVSLPEVVTHDDYGRTFDLVAALDLLITVPTSVLHVAGAVGTPCWVVMDHRAAWRECSRDNAIPWYPLTHERFVRGPDDDGWCDVLGRIAKRLREVEANGGRIRDAREYFPPPSA